MRSAIRIALTVALIGALAAFAPGCSSGDGSGDVEASTPQVEASTERYRAFLQESATKLVDAARAMAGQIRAGLMAKAESRYARARVPYSHVEPIAETFPGLDARINARLGEAPDEELVGFHRLEEGIFVDRDPRPLIPLVEQLVADTEELRRRIRSVDLQPAGTLRAATGLLEETSVIKLTGKEERHADLDLVDVAASVEGAEAGFEAVRPLVGGAAEIEKQFDRAYAAVGEYGTLAREEDQPRELSPGTSFVVYSEVPQAELDKMTQQVDALVELLHRASAEVE